MQDELLALFEPAKGVQDDGYDELRSGFDNNGYGVAYTVDDDDTTVYMLLYNT